MPIITLQIGKGLRNNAPPYQTVMVFGADLNVPEASGWGALPSIVEETAVFDLSGLLPNKEVVVGLLKISGTLEDSYQLSVAFWPKPPTKKLYEKIFTYPAERGGWVYCYGYIGYVPWEINKNGLYQVIASIVDSKGALYTGLKEFEVIGIKEEPEPEPEPEPVPKPEPEPFIVDVFQAIAGLFYGIYQHVVDWIWPFNLAANAFLWIADLFYDLADLFVRFFEIVDWVVERAREILTWNNIWQLILTTFPWLLDIRDWFNERFWWVVGIISNWWAEVQTTVRGWIQAAVQWFNDVAAGWWNFWNNLWPQLTGWVDSLRAGWDNFIKVTLPSIPIWSDIEDWFDSRLRELTGFWEGWEDMKDNVITFFQDPVEFIWERFTDWFLGPEE